MIGKTKLTKAEYIILKNLDYRWKYIARDKRQDRLFVYEEMPFRECNESDSWSVYCVNNYVQLPYPNLFRFIKWNDEPYFIEDLLKEYISKRNVEKAIR